MRNEFDPSSLPTEENTTDNCEDRPADRVRLPFGVLAGARVRALTGVAAGLSVLGTLGIEPETITISLSIPRISPF